MKILVIETAFLGDVIISLSLAAELRRLQPAAVISYLVRPDAAIIANACPDINTTFVYDKRGSESGRAGIESKASELNAIGFDVVFLLHGSTRSQRLCSKLNAVEKVGFDDFTNASLTHFVKDEGWSNRYERAVLPATALYENVNLQIFPKLEVVTDAKVKTFASRFSKVVALAPGSAWATKKWGDAKFIELAIACANEGLGILVIGGPEEAEVGSVIENECGPDVALSLCGVVDIIGSAGALAAANILVANDSAPVHLAAAVGIPSLTLFGPTIPEFGFLPSAPLGEAIELKDLWCRPCTPHGSDECPVHTHECMKGLSVQTVFARLIAKLETITVSNNNE